MIHPTGNAQVAYYFMRLNTDRRLNHQHFAPIPLPQEFINVVHRLTRRNPSGLDMHNHNGMPFLNVSDNDKDYPTYTDTEDEGGDETYYDDNYPPPGYDASSVPAGVTTSNIRNLQHNSRVHSNNVEYNDIE